MTLSLNCMKDVIEPSNSDWNLELIIDTKFTENKMAEKNMQNWKIWSDT